MIKKILLPFLAFLIISIFYIKKQTAENSSFITFSKNKIILKEKPKNARALFAIEREKYELEMQINPTTGNIPQREKIKELDVSLGLMQQKRFLKTTSNTYTFRGPSNFGGRTRAFGVDLSDATSNTLLSGGVSSGLYRATNGGTSWTKVTPQGEIHNVTALAQDPRPGFQNIWYYGTGELIGNSASLGSPYRGQGVYKSTDSGQNWTKIAATDSVFEDFDSYFDYTSALKVHPMTGDLFIATAGRIYRYNGTNLFTELGTTIGLTDVVISANGKVYASFEGNTSLEGVWESPTGNGSWTRIAKNGVPTNWSASRRIVLAAAPSNNNIIYALYVNGNNGGIEADLWQYNATSTTWTDYSSKLPDEPGGDLAGNDPFAVQGGYDLVVSVRPNDENFVVIGGANAYKIEDITTNATFTRIGGYANNTNYEQYEGHHPDIHALVFDSNNNNILYSGTDGGVHKTTNIEATSIIWESLNNNYITYQYYHVALDPLTGSDIVIGGAQDNGTTVGGATENNFADNTTMISIAGGDGVAVGIARRDADTNIQLFLGVQQGTIFTIYPNNSGRDITPTEAPSDVKAQFVTYFYLDPDNPNNLYYAGNATLYKTNDAAAVTSETWVNAGELTTNEKLRSFATTRGTYNPLTSFLLIGGDSGGIFKVNDPENTGDISTAINITPPGANKNSGSIVSDIAIHPTNPDIVLIVYANYGIDNIFLSTNATSATPTWTLVERNLSAHSIRSAAITQVGNEIIYFVGTARGLYSSTDPTTKDWKIEGIDSIGLALISGLVYRPSDNRLLIGTHGNGMFETTVRGSTLSTKKYNKSETKISFYPNPAQKELTIQSNTFDLNKNVVYNISDINGKTVKKGIVNSKKINIESLKHGTYFVNLSIEGEKQNFKFIKN